MDLLAHEILRGVHPERNAEILRSAQDDKRRAQNDNGEPFFNKLLGKDSFLDFH